MTKQTTINEAIAAVIKAAGYDTLAQEWMTRPADRAEILKLFTNILKRTNPEHAARFVRLAAMRHAVASHARPDLA